MLDIFSKINEAAKKYINKDVFDKQLFLIECKNCLNEYFVDKLKKNDEQLYLFSALSLRDSLNGNLSFVSIENEHPYLFNKNLPDLIVTDLSNLLSKFIEDAKLNAYTNITSLISEGTINSDICLKFSKVDYSEVTKSKAGIFTFDFSIFSEVIEERIALEKCHSQVYSFLSHFNIDTTKHIYIETKISKYFWRHWQIAKVLLNQNKDYFLHFIYPSTLPSSNTVIVSLATNNIISDNILGELNLLLYKIVGHLTMEEIKQSEKLKTLTSVNNAAHSIKTQLTNNVRQKASGIKYLMKPGFEVYQTELIVEIDIAIKKAAAINITKKIIEGIEIDDLITELSRKKELFFLDSKTVKSTFNLLDYFKMQACKFFCNSKCVSKCSIVSYKTNVLNSTLFCLPKHNFTKLFYEEIFLTVLENYQDHCYKNNSQLLLEVSMSENEIIFKNKLSDTKNNRQLELKGNLFFINQILTTLKVGNIKAEFSNNEYILTLKKK